MEFEECTKMAACFSVDHILHYAEPTTIYFLNLFYFYTQNRLWPILLQSKKCLSFKQVGAALLHYTDIQ